MANLPELKLPPCKHQLPAGVLVVAEVTPPVLECPMCRTEKLEVTLAARDVELAKMREAFRKLERVVRRHAPDVESWNEWDALLVALGLASPPAPKPKPIASPFVTSCVGGKRGSHDGLRHEEWCGKLKSSATCDCNAVPIEPTGAGEPSRFERVIAPPNEAAGCVACDTCSGFRAAGRSCAVCQAIIARATTADEALSALRDARSWIENAAHELKCRAEDDHADGCPAVFGERVVHRIDALLAKRQAKP